MLIAFIFIFLALAFRGASSTLCYENLTLCQQLLSLEIFGVNVTDNFFHMPILVEDLSTTYVMHGIPSSGQGSGVGNVAWTNNMTKLVWEITERDLSLNSTVFWTLSTKNTAPANYPPPPYGNGTLGPGQPTDSNTPWGPHPVAPQTIQDTVVLYHNGHETTTCVPNFDGVVDFLNEIGFDVMELNMPLIGCNPAPAKYGHPTSHEWFEIWEILGYHTMKYFIEPVAQAAHYAKYVAGYKNVVLLGLSGGGWTTTVASAILNDIDLSIPIAGSVPKWRSPLLPDMWVPDLPEGRNPACQPGDPFHPPPNEGAGGDYEQQQGRPLYSSVPGGVGFAELYLLATHENRQQLQILHDYDSCCFRAAGLFTNISKYNDIVQQLSSKSSFLTVVTEGNYHEINLRDKVIVAAVIDRFCQCKRKGGAVQCLQSVFGQLPFNLLSKV